MNKFLQLLFIFTFFTGFLLKINEAAEPADQLIVNYFGTPEENGSLGKVSSQIKRINKTHQVASSLWTLNTDLTDDHSALVNVYRQDYGGWHSLFTRTKDKICSTVLSEDGMAHGMKATLFPGIPDECPLKAGVYNLSRIVIPRYREDWSDEFKKMIPEMVPSADKWRCDLNILDANNETVMALRAEYRLINKFNSQ